jgi:predicted  nucleic acid-binding Zn-ribbon protein
VGNIVDSLFGDYLPRRQQEPMRVADPRQQTMLTNQMLTPVMNKPVTPPNNYSINPPVNPLRSEFTQPTTQPPVVNNRPIYSNNPPIAPDYGFTQPTTQPPVENNRPIYSNNPPIAPDYGFTQPTQPPAPISDQTLIPVMPKPTPPTRDVPLFPSVGGIGGGTVPTQPPAAPVSDQTLTPVMPKPTAPSLKAPQELINPVTTTEEKQQYDQLFGANVSGGVVPTEEETTDSFEEYLSTLTTDDLDNLDLSGVNLDNIDVSSYEEINAALTGGSVAPTDLEGLSQLYQQQVSLLQNVDTLNKVDIDDRPYWYNTGVSGVLGQPSQYSGDEFRAATGLPDSFALYDSGQGLTQENAQRAMSLLSESASPLEAASQYYGIELQAANNPNSNYNNARKYGTSPEKLAEFQSVIEPILQQVIPYLQVTQGLRYDDALEYAYKNDPMIAALYNQYGVDLFRQTDDGSTYFFDPISGTEARTVEVKDSTARDVGLALTLTAAAFILGPVAGKAIASSAGLTTKAAIANTVAATQGALSAAFQGGDVKNILTNALTAGITGPLQTYVSTTLGVSKEVAAAMTQAGLATAQGAGSKEALLSGFLAGVGEYVKGEMPAANQDPDQFGFKGENPDITFDGADAATGSAEAWSAAFAGTETAKAATDAVTTAIAQNPAASLSEIIVTAQRINPNIAADVLAIAAQQVASGAITTGGGMLTADTPAGDVEEVVVTPNNDVLYTVPSKDGVIYQTAKDLLPNKKGERWFEILQEQDPAFHKELLSLIEQNGTDIAFKWKGIPINVSEWYDATSTTTQAPEIVSKEPTQPEGETLPDKPTDEDVEPQPELPETEEAMEIPEFEIENLPPDFNAEIPEVVTPPATPETPVVPRPTEGGGGGSAGGVVVPPPATPPPAAPEAPTDEVVDVFDDGGLTGDAFDDSTTGGAEGGAAEEGGAEGSEGAEGGAAEVGGDAGDVDVTTTEQYKALQSELDNALASQGDLEVEVSNLQNEVAAANAAAKQAQEAAAAAEAAGAANADKLRGEAVAAQEAANKTQSELDSANKALGNADSTIKDLTSKLGASETANVELTKELEKTNTEVATLEGKLSTVKETNTDLTKRLEDSNTKVGELNENLSSAKEDLASLKDEYAEAVVSNKKNVDSLEKKVKSKESEIKGLEKNIKDADSTVKSLEGEISKNKQEITGLEGSLSEALKAVSGLESSLAESEAATKAAIAKGIADAEGAGKEGLGKGLGAGAGLGSAIGLLGGFGMGQAQGGGGVPYTRPEAKDFMAKLNFNLPEAERLQQQQLQDYVGMLLGNMR